MQERQERCRSDRKGNDLDTRESRGEKDREQRKEERERVTSENGGIKERTEGFKREHRKERVERKGWERERTWR